MAIHVEEMITAAIARGELDDLPFKGEPLPEDGFADVPAEQRMTFRILKNAGLAPPEVEVMKKVAALQAELAETSDPEARAELLATIRREQAVLRTHLERMAGKR